VTTELESASTLSCSAGVPRLPNHHRRFPPVCLPTPPECRQRTRTNRPAGSSLVRPRWWWRASTTATVAERLGVKLAWVFIAVTCSATKRRSVDSHHRTRMRADVFQTPNNAPSTRRPTSSWASRSVSSPRLVAVVTLSLYAKPARGHNDHGPALRARRTSSPRRALRYCLILLGRDVRFLGLKVLSSPKVGAPREWRL